MNTQVFIDQFMALPPHLQSQVMDFTAQITSQPANQAPELFEEVDENEPLSPEMEAFLEERERAMDADPDGNLPLDEALELIRKKMGYV